jgi:hypothetical protein
MGENLYEVDHFYTGDFAQFLTGGYTRDILILVPEHIFITDSKVYCVSLKYVQT